MSNREAHILTIKRRLKGSKLFVTDGLTESTNGNKIIGVDAVRIYHPGRHNSTKLDDISAEDAELIINLLTKIYS